MDKQLEQLFFQYEFESKVRFGNKESVCEIIQQMRSDGPTKLRVITGFDYTLSKYHVNGEKCIRTADILRLSAYMSEYLRICFHERSEKLLRVERHPHLTIPEKISTVRESFLEDFADIVDSKIVKRDILDLLNFNDHRFQWRDGCKETLQYFNDVRIPLLIYSAGFGNLIQKILHRENLYYSNTRVVGNFMNFNDRQQLVGFKPPLIHTFNKNSSVLTANWLHDSRKNILLLGDSIGDASMADGVVRDGSLLKIGFLNEVNDEQLKIFLEHFDIVLLNDQTMRFVNFLVEKVICRGVTFIR